MHGKHRPELKAIQDEQTQRIRALLNDSQQAEYTKFLEEREKERQLQPHALSDRLFLLLRPGLLIFLLEFLNAARRIH